MIEPAPPSYEADYDRISPTAIMVAYRRSLSDIPFSADIYELAERRKKIDGSLLRPDLAPQIEARYKMVDKYLGLTGTTQVLELAAGLSPRGINKTADPAVNYVELDLPNMCREKKNIIETLVSSGKLAERPNLHLSGGSALNMTDLNEAASGFSEDRPVTIINEGLMRYLNMDERATLAKNVRTLLGKFGGAWITPDISLKKVFEQENLHDSGHVAKISRLTGAAIMANRFENVEAAKDFFGSFGFNIKTHSWLEVTDQLTSPIAAQVTTQEVEAMNRPPILFVMTAR